MVQPVADFYDPYSGRLTASAGMAGMVCRRTGSATAQSRSYGNTNVSNLYVDVSNISYPVVALQLGGYYSGSYGKIGNNIVFASTAPVGTSFNWFIFDWAPNIPQSIIDASLFKIFNPDNGLLNFCSGTWPMKLVGLLTLDGAVRGFESGVNLAFANGSIAGHSRPGTASCYVNGQQQGEPGSGLETCRGDIRYRNNGKLYGGLSYNGTSAVQTGPVSVDDVTVSAGNYSNYSRDNRGFESPGFLMIIDVTNIPVGRTFF